MNLTNLNYYSIIRMNAFQQGILMGFAITLSFGPGFIALFQTSVMRGVKAGFVLAVGILASDLVLICISYWGLAKIYDKSNFLVMGIIAGIIFIAIGGVSFFRKPVDNFRLPESSADLKKSMLSLLTKGFVLNFVNPFCLIFWIGIMGVAVNRYEMRSHNFFMFFTGLLTTAFISDLLKCYLSFVIKKMTNFKIYTHLNKLIGLAFMIVGLIIIYKSTVA
jgi:threonine/homoserine/homoserine lactone efflux protein